MGKKSSKKGSRSKKTKRTKGKRRTKRTSSRSAGGAKSGSGPTSSGGGGTMMSLRGGFKGAVGTVTGNQPKTRKGRIFSNIIWTLLTAAALAFIAWKLYQRL